MDIKALNLPFEKDFGFLTTAVTNYDFSHVLLLWISTPYLCRDRLPYSRKSYRSESPAPKFTFVWPMVMLATENYKGVIKLSHTSSVSDRRNTNGVPVRGGPL